MKHLSEEQFVEWASGERNDKSAQHLRECTQCIVEVRRLSLAFEGFKASVHLDSSQRVPFTGAQIRARATTATTPRGSAWRFLPVPALAAVAALAVMWSQPEPVEPLHASDDAADHALLLAVNSDVYRAAPAALRPAAELNKERNQILTSSRKKK